jgi:cytochrome c oxidase subunit III
VNTGPAVRLQPLPLELNGPRAPLWWAMVSLLLIEAAVYGTLVAAYLYLRFHNPAWPPAGFPAPPLLTGGIGVVLLLGSAAAVLWADRSLRRGDLVPLRPAFAAATALAVLFVLVLGWERWLDGYRWDAHAYGSVIWTIAVLQALHALALAVMGAVIFRLAGHGYFTPGRRLGVEVVALLWYFVALVWLPMVFLLYLTPRLG